MVKILFVRRMNLLENIDQLSDLFIRPQRYIYRTGDLGVREFLVQEQRVHRYDFKIKNHRNHNLECSLFSTVPLAELGKIIIYMHCNSGCRLQGLAYVREAILSKFGLFVFDFAGSGNSEGKYVSLDRRLPLIQRHPDSSLVYQEGECKHFHLLMGTIYGSSSQQHCNYAAIKFLQEDHDIQLAILDSPFSSVRQLAMELGRNKTVLPQIFVPLLLSYLKSIIKERAQFDIDDLDLTQVVHSIKVPAIFLSCQKDQLVPFKQSETLFNLYSAPKQLLIIEEEHNQPRKKQTIQRVFKAVQKQINRSMVLTQESAKKKPKLKKKLHLTCSNRQLNMARYSVPVSDTCSIKLGSKPASKGTHNDFLPVARSTVDLSQMRVKKQIIQINVRPFRAIKKVESIHKSQLKNLPIYMTKSCQHVENEKTLRSIDDAPHKPLALEDITYMKHRNTIHHLVDRDSKQPVPRNTWIKKRKNFKLSDNKENPFK